MSAEQVTAEALAAGATLTALVGTNLFPDEIPQDKSIPACTYERQDSLPEFTLDDTLTAEKVQIAVTGWAKTRTEANAIADAAVSAMAAGGYLKVNRNAAYVPELDEYAAVVVFEVWE